MSIDLKLTVTILSAYKFQRSQEYPGVPVRQFDDWILHKEWMQQERKKHQRLVNNCRILLECEEQEKKDNQHV